MITIKKKTGDGEVVQLIAQKPKEVKEQPPTELDSELLQVLGLGVSQEQESPPLGGFKKGDRVVIQMEQYPWTKLWKKGDAGEVDRVWPPTREFEKLGVGYGVVRVVLDTPRDGDDPVTLFNERDLIHEVSC